MLISPLNWIELILSSSKEENMLVLLRYQDPFIEYAIFESCLSYLGLRISALFNRLWISTPVPIQEIACLKITSL